MWEKNRPEVRKVEEHLAKLGTPSGLRVPERRMLILSRTGAPALAKNNKPRTGVEEGEETPLLKETRSALTLHDRSQIPPTPPRPATAEAAAPRAAAVAVQLAAAAPAEEEGEEGEEEEEMVEEMEE